MVVIPLIQRAGASFGNAKPDDKRGQMFRPFYTGIQKCFDKTNDLASSVQEDLHDNNLREWLEQRKRWNLSKHALLLILLQKEINHPTLIRKPAIACFSPVFLGADFSTWNHKPTIIWRRNAMALKDCERCQHSENRSSFGFQLCAQFRLGKFPCMKSTATLPHSSCPGFPPPPALHHRNNQLWTFPSSLTFVLAIQQFLPGFSSSFTPCELILLAAALMQAAVGLFFSPPQCE